MLRAKASKGRVIEWCFVRRSIFNRIARGCFTSISLSQLCLFSGHWKSFSTNRNNSWTLYLYRDYIRFLWFEDIKNIDFEHFENNQLVEYRFTRVLFGLNASPFLLQATLKKHVAESQNTDKFKEKLMNSLHIDDMTAGGKTQSEAKEFYIKCKDTLGDGGFNLRKFKSNIVNLKTKFTKNIQMIKCFRMKKRC